MAATDGRLPHAVTLAQRFPPALLVIAEVPCVPADAPCRLSPSLIHIVHAQHAPIVLINGWLYHQPPGSRIDHLAAMLQTRAYLRRLNIIGVQSPTRRAKLVALGALERSVTVIGNVKFDAAANASSSASGNQRMALKTGAEILGNRRAFTAGCLREHSDVDLVVDAWRLRRRDDPTLLLVLAPRYPNSATMLEHIERVLKKNEIGFGRRTQLVEAAAMQNIECLVLDTLGELVHVYAASYANFVGRDHNLLEAIQYATPTATTSTWNPNYPGFGIFEALVENAAVSRCDTADALHEFLAREQSELPHSEMQGALSAKIASLSGAVARAVELTRQIIQDKRASV